MPNVRYLSPPPGVSEVSRLFYGEMKAQNIKCYEMEQKIGCASNTLRKWLQHPEDAPLKVLIQICKILGISKTRFCTAFGW